MKHKIITVGLHHEHLVDIVTLIDDNIDNIQLDIEADENEDLAELKCRLGYFQQLRHDLQTHVDKHEQANRGKAL